MALFGSDETTPGASAAQDQQKTDYIAAYKEVSDYLDAYAGSGQDQLSADKLSTAYLSMVQPNGKPASDLKMTPATWYSSATKDNYGPKVKAVMLAVKTVWVERDEEGNTLARYEPNSIEVTKTPPKPGVRGFPVWRNPNSGYKVEELFVYALMLPDYPETGVVYFTPTAMSMSACKSWNTKVRNQRLPNGKPAPIFAYSWELSLGLKEAKGSDHTILVSAIRDQLVSRDLFNESVLPLIENSGASDMTTLMLSAPGADE